MNDLLSIADTIERNGGWHVAAVKIRAEVERIAALETEIAQVREGLKRAAEASGLCIARIAELEASLRRIQDADGCHVAEHNVVAHRLMRIARAALGVK